MIRRLILWKVDGLERRLGVSLDYVRHIVRTSLPAFLKFARLGGFAEFRKTLPVEPYFVGCIVAARARDCGSCVQVVVNQAKQAGVAADVLRVVLDGQPDRLSAESADVYRFSEAVSSNSDAPELRETIRRRYGEQALVDLSFGLAASAMFPIIKRTLGFATHCESAAIGV